MMIMINQLLFVAMIMGAFLWYADYLRRMEEEQIKREDERNFEATDFGTSSNTAFLGSVPVAAITGSDNGSDRNAA